MKNLKTTKGFTLIELLVVISIIGLLSIVVMASMNEARKNARDKTRISDLEQAKAALHLYASTNGTYRVVGTGNNGNGQGWFAYDGGTYEGSIAQELVNLNILTTVLHDPLVPANSLGSSAHRPYMNFFHNPGGDKAGTCLFARLENPTTAHIATIDAAPISDTLRSTLKTSYSLNYASCTQ